MQMRSFQHAWGMRNGNGTNGIKLCFSKEEGRKEGSGQDFIRKQFRLYESPRNDSFSFFNLPRNLDDARILKMYDKIPR